MNSQNTLGTLQVSVASLDVPNPELNLSNTEKQMLIVLAHEGGPLGKVLGYFHDYGAALRQSLANADLDDPAVLKQARKIQANMQSCAWVLELFKSILTLNENEEEVAP